MADPLPLTSAAMGGNVTAAVMTGFAERGTFRGLVQAYTNNADLLAAVAAREIVLTAGRTIAGAAPSLAPATAVNNATPIACVITGAGFQPGARVLVDGLEVASTYVSATTINFNMPRATVGAKSVVVVNGQVSHTATFTVT